MISINTTLAYSVLILGVLLAPLFPFYILIIFPVIAILLGATVTPFIFTILVDSFLLPTDTTLLSGLTIYVLILFFVYKTFRTMIVL